MEYIATPTMDIEQLYAAYHRPLLRYINRLVSNQETAEDLVHETFIKALRHWHELDTAAAARSWLYRIATNTAYDHLRRRRAITIGPLTDDHAARLVAPALEMPFDDAEAVWLALAHIPEHYRVPLVLHSWAGYNLTDIATMLGCNVGAIKSRVHRARAQFRQYYVA